MDTLANLIIYYPPYRGFLGAAGPADEVPAKFIKDIKRNDRNNETYVQLTTSYHEKGREEGIREGIRESVLDLLQDKDDYHLLNEKLMEKINSQSEIEILKNSLRKAAKATSVKNFLEE